MPAVVEKRKCSFEEFVVKNRDAVRSIAISNTVRNKDGKTVVMKNDPWRKENEWETLRRDRD